MSLTAAVVNAIAAATPTPTPSSTMPGLKVDENAVTPGWVGFAVTFAMAVLVVVLIVDMTRRVRRVRYRGEIREQLEAEAREQRGEN